MAVWIFLATFLSSFVDGFPDPTGDDYKECGLSKNSYLCDQDGLFEDEDRNRIDHELGLLRSRTEVNASDCETSGVTLGLAVTQSGGPKEVKEITRAVSNWTLDNDCNNTIVIVFSAERNLFNVRRNSHYNHTVSTIEIARFMRREKSNFLSGNYSTAFLNVIQKIWKRVILKSPVWDVETYPNPITLDGIACRLNETGNLCDPDEMLDDEERSALNKELIRFEKRTAAAQIDNSTTNPDFCSQKGLTPMVALARNIDDYTLKGTSSFARRLMKAWNVDKECGKAFTIFVAMNNHKWGFSVVKGKNVSLDMKILVSLFNKQKKLLGRRNFLLAFKKILNDYASEHEKLNIREHEEKEDKGGHRGQDGGEKMKTETDTKDGDTPEDLTKGLTDTAKELEQMAKNAAKELEHLAKTAVKSDHAKDDYPN